jgi:hypothetical protein
VDSRILDGYHQLSLESLDGYEFERVLAWNTNRPSCRLVAKLRLERNRAELLGYLVYVKPAPGEVQLYIETIDLEKAVSAYNNILIHGVQTHRIKFTDST